MPGNYVPSSNQYAQPADLLKYGMPAAALGTPATDTSAQNAALLSASGVVDTYLRQQFQLPLTQWSDDLVQTTCWLAAYNLIMVRGYNPESAADQEYFRRYEYATGWLRDVAAGKVTPNVVSSAPGAKQGAQDVPARPNDYSPNICVVNSTGGSTRGSGQR